MLPFRKKAQLLSFNTNFKKEIIRKNRQWIKRSIGTLIIIGLFSYILSQCILNGTLLPINESFENKIRKLSLLKSPLHNGYFVDLHGCKIPSLDIKYRRILNNINNSQSFRCFQPQTIIKDNLILFKIDKNDIEKFFNITNNENIFCIYQTMYIGNDTQSTDKKTEIIFDYEQPIKINSEDYIKITCNVNDKQFYEYYHIIKKKDFHIEKTIKKNYIAKISVMLIGLNSLSHLNFLRKMKKTSQLLIDTFNAIEFYGYSKVGESSFHNMLPMLTGFDEKELVTACLNAHSYNDCPFLWNIFKEYKTAYAEDLASLGFLKYFPTDANLPPFDFYMKSSDYYMNKLIRSKETNDSSIHYCFNLHPFNIIFEFIKTLISKFVDNNFFSFFWISSWNIGPNKPISIDIEIKNLILILNNSNVLNKTVLFLVSDQGSHSGFSKTSYQGIMEERQPFLFVIVPKWFQTMYPAAILNLRQNSRKLTSHFDLHETIRDLKKLSTISNKQISKRSQEIQESDIYPRGISLFLTIPNNRTCEHAGIAYDWCTCHEKQFIPTNDPKVQRAARFIINIIKEKLEGFVQCRALHLNSILYASISSANKKVIKDIKDEYISDLMVKIQTKPGLAVYEAIVRMDSYSTYLVSNITAIKSRGKYNFCSDDNNIRDYCYCSR